MSMSQTALPNSSFDIPGTNHDFNALDPFLLHPLGQFSVEDWERALYSDMGSDALSRAA